MRICIPTTGKGELDEAIYDHFGSAPAFTVVDAGTMAVEVVTNANRRHRHGQCNPAEALSGTKVDAIIVKGIGAGAAARLEQMGIPVYQTQAATVAEAVDAMKQGTLPRVSAQGLCGHRHGDAHGKESHCC